MIKAIIFDFNGVIVDDEPLHEKAFRQACFEFDLQLSSGEYLEMCLGRTDRDGFERVQDKFSLSDVMREKMFQRKSQIYFDFVKKGIYPVVGVIDFINTVKDKFSIALATAAYRPEVEMILRELCIRGIFKVIVSAQDVAKSKPDPAPYLLAAEKLDVLPSACLVIEDTPSGIASAKGAGMSCIAITTTRNKAELQEADLIVDNFSQLSHDTVQSFGR